MPNRFSAVEKRHSDTAAADVRASHCQRLRSSSLRERASVVPRAAPVFLAPLCDITRPAPLPLLGCARRQRVLHGVILLASGARALSPSSQYIMGEGGRQAGGGAHVSTRPGSQPLNAYSFNKLRFPSRL